MSAKKPSLAIHSRRTWLNGQLQPATVFVKNARIHSIEKGKPESVRIPIKDVSDAVLMPGLTEPHLHINEPGRTGWEGFDTATRAAAAGGITTLVDMPLNSSPVTTTLENFQKKLAATQGKLHVNTGFWGGIVPNNADHLQALLSSGVLGIKAFLTHSGIEEFPNVTEEDLRKGLPAIAKSGLPLLVHCELSSEVSNWGAPTSYQAYLRSRPKAWENKAIELMIGLCREYKCRIHIVHLSSAEALPAIKKAKGEGLPLTVETCPHYLFFNAENIPDADPRFKCAPPIRERSNNDQLWEALGNGIIDFIATDHSPAPPEMKLLKSGNLLEAWGGIASLQWLLPIVWTGARAKNFTIENVINWLAEAPAAFIGQNHRKGKIAVGYDADLVVWQPEESFTVKTKDIFHRHKTTPYLDQQLFGKVVQTYVNGVAVYEDGKMTGLDMGKVVFREA